MKLVRNIWLLATIGLFTACNTDVETPRISKSPAFVAPVINQCDNVIVNADNSKDETVVFSWTAADFGQPLQILYSLYLTDGTNSAFVANSNTTNLAINKGDLNGIVINNLGVSANSTVSVSAYVTAKIANTNLYPVIQSNASNSFTVSTYAAALKYLYLCGEATGWDIEHAPIFYETSGGTNIYSFMANFNQGIAEGKERSYFKITVAQNWSGANWGYNFLTPSWTCPEQADSNLSLDLSEGNIFAITVNTVAMTIDRKAVGKSLGLVGSFNNWGKNNDAPFTYDYVSSSWKTSAINLESNAEIKVRIDAGWDTNWGASGTMSTAINGGYELTAGGNNVTVPEAGTYIVILHANRTPYVLELAKQ